MKFSFSVFYLSFGNILAWIEEARSSRMGLGIGNHKIEYRLFKFLFRILSCIFVTRSPKDGIALQDFCLAAEVMTRNTRDNAYFRQTRGLSLIFQAL